jgi:adenylate cyclase
MSNRPSFFAELKRRNVYRVAIAYAVTGWALAEGASQIFPVFDIPNWAVRLIVLAIVVGFPIALVIAWAFELTPEGLKRTEDADQTPLAQRPARRIWVLVVIIAGAISLGLFFLGRYTAGNHATPRQSEATTAVPAKSIAVLPFVNMSGKAGNDDFSDGITEEILNALSQISDLKVVARTSAFQFKGKNVSMPAAASIDAPRNTTSARVSTPRFYQWLSPLFDDPRFAPLEYKVRHSAISVFSETTP